MLEKLLEFYRKSDGATKKKILGCIFAEKLVLKHRAQGTELSMSETCCDYQTENCTTARQKSVRFREVPKKTRGQF